MNGCVRDTAVLSGLDLAVKALGTCPRRTEKRGFGEIDGTVPFGGATFVPGHYLYADQDGVVLCAQPLEPPAR